MVPHGTLIMVHRGFTAVSSRLGHNPRISGLHHVDIFNCIKPISAMTVKILVLSCERYYVRCFLSKKFYQILNITVSVWNMVHFRNSLE